MIGILRYQRGVSTMTYTHTHTTLYTQEAGFLEHSLHKPKQWRIDNDAPNLASVRTRITEFAIVYFYFFCLIACPSLKQSNCLSVCLSVSLFIFIKKISGWSASRLITRGLALFQSKNTPDTDRAEYDLFLDSPLSGQGKETGNGRST